MRDISVRDISVRDIPEKTRRNLITISTAIILFWFLGSPFQGKVLWVLDLTNVSPWRVWAVALVILVYCFFRFHTEPETTKKRNKEISIFLQKRKEYIEVYLFKHVTNCLNKEKKPTNIIPFETPGEDYYLSELSTTYHKGKILSLDGCIAVLVWQHSGKEKTGHHIEKRVNYSLSYLDSIKVFFCTLYRGKWFKWPLLEYGFPYILSVIAMIISLWSIYTNI